MSSASKNVLLVLTSLTLLLLSSRSVLVTAEDITRIHTPDFPEYLNSILNETTSAINYSEYFQIVKELFDLANSNVSFDELLKNSDTSEDLDKLIDLLKERGDLENAHKVEALRDYSFLSPQELLQDISSDKLRDLLQKALESGSLSEEILEEISNMYFSGNISFDDYLKALYFIKGVSGGGGGVNGGGDGGGGLAGKVNSLLMDVLLSSLTDSSLKILGSANTDLRILESDVASEALKSMLDFFSKEPSNNRGLTDTLESLLEDANTSLPSVPEPKFPQFNIDLPAPATPSGMESVSASMFFLPAIILSGVTAYLLLKQRKFTTVLTRLPIIRDYFLEDLNIRSEVIRIYWGSVKLLKERVSMLPNETHREYLDKVVRNIPNVSELFKRITEAYERVRWGAQEEKLFIYDTQRAYENLMRELSRL